MIKIPFQNVAMKLITALVSLLIILTLPLFTYMLHNANKHAVKKKKLSLPSFLSLNSKDKLNPLSPTRVQNAEL